MTTFANWGREAEPRLVRGNLTACPIGRRDQFEILGFLIGTFGILLALAVTIGGAIPFGQ